MKFRITVTATQIIDTDEIKADEGGDIEELDDDEIMEGEVERITDDPSDFVAQCAAREITVVSEELK